MGFEIELDLILNSTRGIAINKICRVFKRNIANIIHKWLINCHKQQPRFNFRTIATKKVFTLLGKKQ